MFFKMTPVSKFKIHVKIMTQHNEETTIRTIFEIINAGGMENLGEALSCQYEKASMGKRLVWGR
jgi:hypothetical protein